MKSDHTEYNIKESIGRISNIIELNNYYEVRDSIPPLKELSYTNGFYTKCSAICVSVRGSPQLGDLHKSKELAQLYRAYISEVSAVLNGNPKCAEICIERDCIFAVFDSPFSEDLDEVFSTAAKISSVIDIINHQFRKTNAEIIVGIGVAYGKALVLKAGYKGSGISENIWGGEALDEATRLASYGNKEPTDKETMISEIVYFNLNSENQKILSFNSARKCYHGDTVNVFMNRWYKQNYP